MAKQNGSFLGKLFKKTFFLAGVALLGFGSYLAWQHRDELPHSFDFSLSENEPTYTFEIVYTPEQIMQKNQKELLRTGEHTFSKAYVKFVPMVLMHVKYAQDYKRTEEAECLWDLQSGEMVVDTSSFETTHGFEDCITSRATLDDFRIIHAILRHANSISKDQLAQELGLEQDILTERLDTMRKKHLIIQKLDTITLHFQNPFIKVSPKTKISQSLVQKVISKENQVMARFSKDDVRKVAYAAFGQDFAIRSVQEVYLPVVFLEVQNPDGSTLKVSYNAITGKKLPLSR